MTNKRYMGMVVRPTQILMRPLIRVLTIGVVSYVIYAFARPPMYTEAIPPFYAEKRKAMGLPDVKIKHPVFFMKESRIIPKEELVIRRK